MPPYRNYIYEYHAKITSGEIIAGKWIKKIYEIIINGLQKQEYFFNAKAANKAIRFIENFCHHSKGRNDLIKLELWPVSYTHLDVYKRQTIYAAGTYWEMQDYKARKQ